MSRATSLLIVVYLSMLASAQETPNRDMPPKLSDFAREAAPRMNVRPQPSVAKLQEENLKLKQALTELQLERAVTLLRPQVDRANVLRSSVWQTTTIEVHWENPQAASEQERNWVRQAVTDTWERHSQLRFVGWDAADSNSRGIRIRISDEGPHCKRLGGYLNGMVDGMVLNFNFQNWCPDCGADREGSIKKIAAHEFGHAIGFAHEQNRDDAPDWCQRERQGSNGDWYITIYDPQSIMNYCNPDWNNNGLLSDMDKLAVQTLYGAPNAAPTPAPGLENHK